MKKIILLVVLVMASCIEQEQKCSTVESPFESLAFVSEITVTKYIFVEVSIDQMKIHAGDQPVYCMLNTHLDVSDEWGERILDKGFLGNAGWVSFVLVKEKEIFYATWKPVEASDVSYKDGVFIFCS